ncbi:MAG TPA: helix-turn-helix domain-containing protein [Gemmatimonadaceae bacterium]|nr:helix-turn-helix domain-containing protein [Gemmatimonadaceae bacterium]
MASRPTRPYRSVQRSQIVDAGRDRIVSAARELLEADEAEAFSIDAVARRAGVARMTVYNQFESKAGLLEALFDSLAERAGLGQIAEVFRETDVNHALDLYVAVFGRFWTANRRAHRRLRAAALQDTDLEAAIAQRNERRRRGLNEFVRRLGKSPRSRANDGFAGNELVNVLFVLLSFETFDALAGPERTPDDMTPTVQRLARLIIDA